MIALYAVPLSAEVIWSADPHQSANIADHFKRFDGGNYPQDYCATTGDEENTPPLIAIPYDDSTMGLVWKVNKPVNRKRGELARFEGRVNSYAPKEGDDVYIGWQWKIDSTDGKQIDTNVAVFQWKSAGPHYQNYPFTLAYDGNLTLNAFGADYTGTKSQSVRKTVLWKTAVSQNEWVSLVFRVKVDSKDHGGLIQFWFNGELQSLKNNDDKQYRVLLSNDGKTAYHRTHDGSFVYPKWGIYNKSSCKLDISAYFHNMKVGTSIEDVMPTFDN